jgi:formylglycine-generating enzyme required for sulfatase activity
VLLPGGRFLLGAQRTDPAAPNYDPKAQDDEAPVNEVELDPFFLSKYEMTQAQWLRATGANPSKYGPDSHGKAYARSLLHPVELVSWNDCMRTMQHLALTLPTEAQWEYAARGGTSSPWWTGDERESLRGAVNIADAAAARAGADWASLADWPGNDDGFALHAPVGSLAANPFGLHDVLGNVYEWCRDMNGPYDDGRRAGDGEAPPTDPLPAMRGGCYELSATEARVSARGLGPPDFTAPLIGLRPALGLPR